MLFIIMVCLIVGLAFNDFLQLLDAENEQIFVEYRPVWQGVSKGEEDGRRPPALRAGHPPNGR
jgi:hypothetical protein